MLKKLRTKYTFKHILKKGEVSLIDFWEKSKIEVVETKDAKNVFVKYVAGKEITEHEKQALKNQSFDLVKIIFIGIPLAVVPGFSVVLIILVRVGQKYKFNVLPSSFTKKKDE